MELLGWIAVALIASSVVYVCVTRYSPRRLSSEDRGLRGLGAMTLTFVLILMTVTILRTEVRSGSMIVASDGKTILTAYDRNVVRWRWGRELSAGKLQCCWTDVESDLEGRFEPITPNPKVRQFYYKVQLIHFGTPEAWMDFQRNGTRVDVASLLYDFQNDHSKELAEFSNPRRPEQQAKFSNMIRAYLDPYLKNAGTRIQSVSFDLEGPRYLGWKPSGYQLSG
jgi:hypothetical protein